MSDQPVSIRVDDANIDWTEALSRLNKVLRIRTTPIGMKMFETVDEMEAIERIRRPNDVHTADQIVSMASRLNWTVGITGDDLAGAQCASVLGLGGQDDDWYSGRHMAGVWFETVEEASEHQHAMHVVPVGKYSAMATSPLSSGRLSPPDICMIYATPGQMIILINGLQWSGYKKLEWGCVGESSCADSWGRALSTGEPSVSIPCYAERRYGGVSDDEMLIALSPQHLLQSIGGMEALSRNGLRYPIPPYGIQTDARAGLGVSY
ncbi:MAG: DUF169 domain-containing protein [Actinobacteria bacterium]|nr:DUF169 domain-containing protein [Actinomycetota bacterium]